MSVKLRRQKKQKPKPLRSSHPAPSLPPLLEVEDLRVARKGERLYRTKLKALLEPDYTGMFAAIEPDSGFNGELMMSLSLIKKLGLNKSGTITRK